MKKAGLLIAIIFLALSELLISAPLRNYPIKVSQPDGTVLNLFVTGDEYYNWVHDENNYTIIQDDNTGYYVYALQSGDDIKSSVFVVGKVLTLMIPGLQKGVNISPEKIKQRIQEHRKNTPKDEIDAPTTGTINKIVVFIRFSGESEFTDTKAYYDGLYNNSTSGANSMYNYFQAVSYNTLSVTSTYYPAPPGTTVISYQDSHIRGYFQPYNRTTNPTGYQTSADATTREHTLLRDAVNYINAYSPIPSGLNLDGDNDGDVDGIGFIISGNVGAWADLLWPHMWALYSYTVSINGKHVYEYDFQIQTHLQTYGVGVLCHEMFHALGSPDLYHYYNYLNVEPVSQWDVMEWNMNPPQHMGAYMKFKYGKWISSIPVISSGTYTLNPLTSPTNNCYRINSPYSSTEYYVVEYRKRNSTFENSLPGDGLLVYRINTLYEGNANGPPDEVYIYRPGGTSNTVNGTPSTANYNSTVGRTAINGTTNPSAFLSNGTYGGLDISDITAAGETISFTLPTSLPSSATISYPSNSAVNVYKPNLSLNWINSTGASGVRIYFGTNNPPSNILNGVDIGLVSSYTPSLNYGTQYYWKIVPYNINGNANNCPVWNFTTQANSSFGGGLIGNGYYYFANSTPDAVTAPSQPQYLWQNTATTEITSWTNGNGNEGYFRIPDIGFNFEFFGTLYRTSNIYINSNGFLSFGSGSTSHTNVTIPNSGIPNNFIAAAWADLNCRTSTYSDAHVYYGGNASQFVITYWHAHKVNSTEYITFQIILKNDYSITIQFNDTESSTPLTNSITTGCTVGIENIDGTKGIKYRYATSSTNVTGGPMFGSPLALTFSANDHGLPVSLGSFNSSVTGRDIKLNWNTTSEINNTGFEIERAEVRIQNSSSKKSGGPSGNQNWEKIGYVQGNGTVNTPTNYKFEDKNLQTGKYKYRLKQIDNNGNFEYFALNGEVEVGVPKKFDLSQNYPNPFNPTTKIDFDLPIDSKVNIVLYDMNGREVRTLVNGARTAGYHTVQFNANDLSSGIYFYRISADKFVMAKKMMLIK